MAALRDRDGYRAALLIDSAVDLDAEFRGQREAICVRSGHVCIPWQVAWSASAAVSSRVVRQRCFVDEALSVALYAASEFDDAVAGRRFDAETWPWSVTSPVAWRTQPTRQERAGCPAPAEDDTDSCMMRPSSQSRVMTSESPPVETVWI
jgi:hypothetical protein